jgi:hypothetical protein
LPANGKIIKIDATLMARHSINCHKGTSTTVIFTGITIIDEKGSNDAMFAIGLLGFCIIDIAMKNGIIIRIIIGHMPDWAS